MRSTTQGRRILDGNSASISPESNFLLWIGTRSDVATALEDRIPQEIFSDEGRKIWLAKSWPSVNGIQPSEPDALLFLRSQALAILAREAGRAQKSGKLDGVRWATEFVEQSFDGLQAPPIFEFEKIQPEIRSVIPTGVESLDEQIQGIAKGDLGVWAAPPGRGKTLVLINLAVNALLAGYRVLYVTVGDQSIQELSPRIVTCILETPAQNVTEETLRRRHEAALKQITGKLWIADYTDRTCSLLDVERAMKEHPADIVVIDHADDLINGHSNDLALTRHSLRVTYVTLKKLATQFQTAVWTASQSHEYLWKSHEGSTADLAESKVGKSSPAALILIMTEYGAPNIVNVTIAKARRAYKQRIVQMSIDTELMRIW